MFKDIECDDTGVSSLARLGAQAKGVDVSFIEVPTDDPAYAGLPSKVPAGLVRGDTPTIIPLKSNIEAFRIRPARKSGTAKVTTLASFIDLVNRHKTDNSAVFTSSDWTDPSMRCVVDYHEIDGTPANLSHTVRYMFPLSEEWKAWRANNGASMDQIDFATFIEDHIEDLTAVSSDQQKSLESLFQTTFAEPSKMVELSRGLQINAETKATSAVTLQTGEGQISWEEVHNSPGGGKLIIPGVFAVNVSPFFMGEKVVLPIRLRYRIRSGVIKWSYHLYRPDVYVTKQIEAASAKVKTETGLPIYEGYPESS